MAGKERKVLRVMTQREGEDLEVPWCLVLDDLIKEGCG